MIPQATLENVIQGLDYENFKQFVFLFQEEFFSRTPIDVDGSHDGGNDICVFSDKKALKICIQHTTQKTQIEDKLNKDLKKIQECIEKYSFLPIAEIYVSQKLSNDTKNKLTKNAAGCGVIIKVYSAEELAGISLKLPGCSSFLKSRYQEAIGSFASFKNLSKEEKMLLDCLSIGKDSHNLKESILHSIAVGSVYNAGENGQLIDELCRYIQSQCSLSKKDAMDQINRMRGKKILIPSEDRSRLLLSSDEHEKVQIVFEENQRMEGNFLNSLSIIFKKYGIEKFEELATKLLNIHMNYFLSLLNENATLESSEDTKIGFYEFKKIVSQHCPPENLDSIIEEIAKLCKDNPYLSKISAEVSFVELFRSKKLEQYVKNKTRILFFDTPIASYYLLWWSNLAKDLTGEDWNDPYYIACANLFETVTNTDAYICCPSCYIDEIVGQIQQAKRLSLLEEKIGCDLNELGKTRNIFFNYYDFVRRNSEVDSIEKFFDELNIDGFDDIFKDNNFKTFNSINTILDSKNIMCTKWYYRDDTNSNKNTKVAYEKTLSEEDRKADKAIENDVAVSILLTKDISEYSDIEYEYADIYWISWDRSLYRLLTIAIDNVKGSWNHNIIVLNPYQMSAKMALETFKISESKISNGIFCYADKNYGEIIHGFLDQISSLVNEKTNRKVLRLIKEIKINQISLGAQNIQFNDKPNSVQFPIEDTIKLLVDIFGQKVIFENEKLADDISNTIKDLINSTSQDERNDCLLKFKQKVDEASQRGEILQP